MVKNMVQIPNTIYSNKSPKTIAYTIIQKSDAIFSSAMKRSVKPQFILLLLIVAATTFGFRVAVRNGYHCEKSQPLDFPLFNSTLLELAEIDESEPKSSNEILQLLQQVNFNFTVRKWVKSCSDEDRIPMSRSVIASIRPTVLAWLRKRFTESLTDWAGKRRFEPEIMTELINKVKIPISGTKKKYSSCAVVGNSGILLNKEYGELIDSHETVIRLNNAQIGSYPKNVGSKTSISFVNSNVLHLCAREKKCFCHPYGTNVPIVMYMCQPVQFLDYVICNSSHESPLIVTDQRFDMICARLVKYYSLKRFANEGLFNKTYEKWYDAHDGVWFHYSSGMQAVTLALGLCDRVNLFGFGKSNVTRHHYHTNQTKELNSHDYEAEYDFYHDLVKKPCAIPFFPEKFEFPPVVIHR
ncbi:beta-1,6-galactosyltransferase GALT29A-like [Silene latifolia]|uniref:beta-1,6-galactosyltransferase GALT29A-like n=1 Tax=Silene latifolia TaxID=37657 RepID=UPI003D77BB6C